jgi:predicted nucleic acid-binding protein
VIVVDASVWLSYLVESDIHHATSRRWLSQVLAEGEAIAAPVLLLAEIAGAITRQTGRPELAQRAIDRLLGIPNLRLVSLDHGLGIEAARVAAAQRLRGADASYVSVAAALGVALVSWDREQLARAAEVVDATRPG